MKIKLSLPPEVLRENFLNLKTTEGIANLLEVKYSDFLYWIYRTSESRRYTSFSISKKSGKSRKINAPTKSIKILQKKLNIVLAAVYKPKPSAHGFVAGRSVKTNALLHIGRKYLLNIDIKDFFPSINFGRVRGMFMGKPYNLPPKVSTFLAHLCCYRGVLPQGAPTSPILSNMICAQMDSQLQRLAADNRCIYSRYADDMSFSTSRRSFPTAIAVMNDLDQVGAGPELTEIIHSNGFVLHPEKIWLRRQDRRQEVTGITVNVIPNLTRKYTNNIRAMLHSLEKYGVAAAQDHFQTKYDKKHRAPGKRKPPFLNVLKGKIEYLGMIKGKESSTYLRFLDKLGRFAPELTGGRGTPLEILLRRYDSLNSSTDPHGRGFLLQDLLRDVFEYFGMSVQKSFTRNAGGEQIDGAFVLNSWHYIVESRWREKVADGRQVDGLLGQVLRSGGQTIGVFFSINGWSAHVPDLLKQNPSKKIILMNGDDFRAILNGKISMQKSIEEKMAELNLKSEPFISVDEIIKKSLS